MDEATLLGLLTILVSVNTLAVLALFVMAVRAPGPESDPRTLPAPPTSTPTSYGLLVAGVGPAVAGDASSSDPLAEAISAFLDRPDGVFRSGGASPGRSRDPSPVRVEPPRAAPPEPAAGHPAPDPVTPPAPMRADASPQTVPAGGAGNPPVFERQRSEVTWSPSRPARYVPSGSDSASRGRGVGPGPVVDGPGSSPPATPLPQATSAPRSRPGARLEITLTGRDPGVPEPAPGAFARLDPVIGGLLRERTREADSVVARGPGRFSVTLPDTPVEGAAALSGRLAQACNAWLAAEQPPLRLELAVTPVADGGEPGSGASRRGPGPDRRRPIPLDT